MRRFNGYANERPAPIFCSSAHIQSVCRYMMFQVFAKCEIMLNNVIGAIIAPSVNQVHGLRYKSVVIVHVIFSLIPETERRAKTGKGGDRTMHQPRQQKGKLHFSRKAAH